MLIVDSGKTLWNFKFCFHSQDFLVVLQHHEANLSLLLTLVNNLLANLQLNSGFVSLTFQSETESLLKILKNPV
jgi:hypothetical protein